MASELEDFEQQRNDDWIKRELDLHGTPKQVALTILQPKLGNTRGRWESFLATPVARYVPAKVRRELADLGYHYPVDHSEAPGE